MFVTGKMTTRATHTAPQSAIHFCEKKNVYRLYKCRLATFGYPPKNFRKVLGNNHRGWGLQQLFEGRGLIMHINIFKHNHPSYINYELLGSENIKMDIIC